MRVFTGQYERTIDPKGRLQLPTQLRSEIAPREDGVGLFVQLGEDRGTLALFTEREFEGMARRIETEFDASEESRQFERQFYSLAVRVELDDQGRFVVPERLRRLAKLRDDIYVIGQKNRIEVWNREDWDRALGLTPDADAWPIWRPIMRRRFGREPKSE